MVIMKGMEAWRHYIWRVHSAHSATINDGCQAPLDFSISRVPEKERRARATALLGTGRTARWDRD